MAKAAGYASAATKPSGYTFAACGGKFQLARRGTSRNGRYLMKAIRVATTNQELGWSGPFSHLPGTEGSEYKEAFALDEIKRETERLTDALNRDSVGYRSQR